MEKSPIESSETEEIEDVVNPDDDEGIDDGTEEESDEPRMDKETGLPIEDVEIAGLHIETGEKPEE